MLDVRFPTHQRPIAEPRTKIKKPPPTLEGVVAQPSRLQCWQRFWARMQAGRLFHNASRGCHPERAQRVEGSGRVGGGFEFRIPHFGRLGARADTFGSFNHPFSPRCQGRHFRFVQSPLLGNFIAGAPKVSALAPAGEQVFAPILVLRRTDAAVALSVRMPGTPIRLNGTNRFADLGESGYQAPPRDASRSLRAPRGCHP